MQSHPFIQSEHFADEHLELLQFSLRALQLLPWSHRRDTWPKLNCIKAQWECIFSQWASTVGFKPLTLGQSHCRWATKTCVEDIHFADREWGSSCQTATKKKLCIVLWHQEKGISVCELLLEKYCLLSRQDQPTQPNNPLCNIKGLRYIECA